MLGFRSKKKELLAAQAGVDPVKRRSFDMEDIDVFFQKNGRGSHLLEYDFTPDTPEPVSDTTENGHPSQFWCWTHKHTRVSVKRYSTASGKSFDSGRLSKYLKIISQREFPLGYARARKILSLNQSGRQPEAPEDNSRTSLDRREILGQQVCPLLSEPFCPCQIV